MRTLLLALLSLLALAAAQAGNSALRDDRTRDVCIIGAGAAGMSAAVFLKDRGYDTLVFEIAPQVGGHCNTIRTGAPQFSPTGDLLYPGYIDVGVVVYQDTQKANASGKGLWSLDAKKFAQRFVNTSTLDFTSSQRRGADAPTIGVDLNLGFVPPVPSQTPEEQQAFFAALWPHIHPAPGPRTKPHCTHKMLRVTAIAAALILLFLLPAVAIHTDDVSKHRKEDLAKDTSEAYRSVKEHVKEMKEDLVDSLREKGVEFKKGTIEGESDAKHDAYEHMPTLNDKINEAAHDTGYFAGATKEKLSETGEKLSESVHDAKETLKHKLFGAADAAKDKAADAKAAADSAKEKVKDAGARAKDSLDATKEKFKENLADAADNIARNKESIKESLKEAGIKAKEGVHYASDKVAEGAEALKADAEDALGHAKWKAEYAARKAGDATKENLDRLKDELHAEGHIIGHGVEAVKDSAANIKDEFKAEAKIIKDDASGLWQWLTGWFSGAKHTVAAKLKEEEAHTKSEIARQLHKAANAQDEEANRARAEYEALLSRLYGADESAKEVHRKLRREQQQMRRAAEAAKEKAHAATESLRESATELKHKAGAKFEETKEKVKEVAHDAKEKLSEKLHDLEGSARHGAQDLARECMLAEERIVGEAKSLAEADLKHQHGCNLREEVRLAEELRKAKEQREFVTESEERPKTGHGVGDSLRRAFQALNPFVGHA